VTRISAVDLLVPRQSVIDSQESRVYSWLRQLISRDINYVLIVEDSGRLWTSRSKTSCSNIVSCTLTGGERIRAMS
jgi:hypothetical protein